MSLYGIPDDLSIRLQTQTEDRIITRLCSPPTFRKVAGGGHADAQITVNAPLSDFPDLGPDARLWIYDRTGATIFEGFTNNPGQTYGDSGQSFALNVAGIMTLASDMASPVLYRDATYDHWLVGTAQTPSARQEISVGPDGAGLITGLPCLLFGFNPGQPLGDGAGLAGMQYDANVLASGQRFGVASFFRDAGQTSTDYRSNARDGVTTWYSNTLSSIGDLVTGFYGIDYMAGTGLSVFLTHSGAATNVSSTVDTLWLAWHLNAVLGTLLDQSGTEVAPARMEYLLSHEVAADAVRRFLSTLDPNRVSVDTSSSYQIDQLVYATPTRLQQILDDLSLYEPDYTWEITPSINGLVGFNYRPWGTAARYVISTRDGYQITGSDADLCNRVSVAWTDVSGKPQATLVSSVVPALGDRVRYADPVTLPDGQGSAANATKVGQAVLAAASQPPSSGTAIVARRILDTWSGRMIAPYEIEPGYLVRVRETGEDLRLTEISYDHGQRAAQLTLGDPVYDTDQIIAAQLRGRQLIPLNSGGTYVAA